MKKIISMIMAIAMILTVGVVAFANDPAEYEVGETYAFAFTMQEGEKITEISDKYNLITFTKTGLLDGSTTTWITTATMTKKGITRIVIKYIDINEEEKILEGKYIDIVNPAAPGQAGSNYLGLTDLGYTTEKEFIDSYFGKSKIAFDLTGFDGISAEVYNATAKLNPATITLYTDDYEVVLYCGDYTKLTLKKDVKINTMITSGSEWIYNNKNMNNQVLMALGNTSADPYYVSIDSTNLTELADNPKLTLKLNNESFDKWSKTNDCKAMDIYSFDPATNDLTLVEENVSVNNLYDKWLEMPTIESAYYVLVNADDVVTDSNNTTKPNVSTGGNPIVSVFATFALMGAAIVATKKIVK